MGNIFLLAKRKLRQVKFFRADIQIKVKIFTKKNKSKMVVIVEEKGMGMPMGDPYMMRRDPMMMGGPAVMREPVGMGYPGGPTVVVEEERHPCLKCLCCITCCWI